MEKYKFIIVFYIIDAKYFFIFVIKQRSELKNPINWCNRTQPRGWPISL